MRFAERSDMPTTKEFTRRKLHQSLSVPSRFGPVAHNSWALDGSRISLVRSIKASKKVVLEATNQTLEVDLSRSALIVVDMQNDFCHPRGWFGQRGVNTKLTRKPVAILNRLLPAWRSTCSPVVWLNWGVRPDRLNLSPTIQFKGKRSADGVGYAECSPQDNGRSLVAGEWGAQVIDELNVASTDITVFKHRLSGFWDNEFDSILRQQGITTLFFTGVNTDRCVFSTLQDAAFNGYDCILLKDACSTTSPAYVTKAILFLVEQLHGFVTTADDLISQLISKPSRVLKSKRPVNV
jgi:ureidoacrylate peracid hydrolase